MDDLRARFRRIDRMATPDLWPEAVGRAAASETSSPPRPMQALTSILVAALLLALLVGVVAVGMSQRPRVEGGERLIVASECALVSVSPDEADDETIVGDTDTCINEGSGLQTASGGGRIALRTTCGACFGFDGTGAQWAGTIDASTGEVRELDACRPDEGQCLGDVSITPDGRRVAYTRWNLATDLPELVLVDLETDDRRTVPLPVLPYGGTSWTPDGEAVIVSAGEELAGQLVGRIYRVPFAGDPTPILESEGIGMSAITVSPDGRSVAYVTAPATTDVPREVRRASTDGSENEAVWRAPDGGTFIGISWSSDSTRLAVTEVMQEMMTGPLAIHVVDVESGAQMTPYETDGTCCRLGQFTVATWSPDGRTLRLALYTDPDLRGTFAIPADGSGPPLLLSEELVVGWLVE